MKEMITDRLCRARAANPVSGNKIIRSAFQEKVNSIERYIECVGS